MVKFVFAAALAATVLFPFDSFGAGDMAAPMAGHQGAFGGKIAFGICPTQSMPKTYKTLPNGCFAGAVKHVDDAVLVVQNRNPFDVALTLRIGAKGLKDDGTFEEILSRQVHVQVAQEDQWISNPRNFGETDKVIATVLSYGRPVFLTLTLEDCEKLADFDPGKCFKEPKGIASPTTQSVNITIGTGAFFDTTLSLGTPSLAYRFARKSKSGTLIFPSTSQAKIGLKYVARNLLTYRANVVVGVLLDSSEPVDEGVGKAEFHVLPGVGFGVATGVSRAVDTGLDLVVFYEPDIQAVTPTLSLSVQWEPLKGILQ